MATTTLSGPIVSTAGFSSAGTNSSTVLRAASGTVTNLLATSLTVGTTKLVTSANAASGTVGTGQTWQVGHIQVMIGATTAYIALYSSMTI